MRLLRLAPVALGAALLLGCARASQSAANERSRPLEIVVSTTPSTLDPRFATDAVSMRVTRLVHAGLVRLDPDTLEPLPYAARSFRWIDASTLEVVLRPDVRFHGGAPLSSADVCATLAALADPALLSPHRTVVKDIAHCEATAPDVVRLVLGSPHATLLTDLEVPILRADEAHLPPRPAGDLDGLGPYRIAHADESAVELVPADRSAFPRPPRAVTVRTIHDENARALRLLAGLSDIAPNAISPTLLPALEGHGDLVVKTHPGANVTYLILQNERPPFDHVETRRAVAQALDRNAIARDLWGGRAHVASSFFPPGSIAHPADLAPMPFDPAGAEHVLGAPDVRARPLSLLTSTDRIAFTLARVMAQQLRDAGLDVEVVPLDFGLFMHRLAAGDFELAALQMPELTEPNVLRWFFHSGFIPSAERPSAGANRAHYRSKAVDAWLDLAAAELDPGKRAALYDLAARRLADDMPVVPLFHTDQIAVVSARARAFAPSAEGRWLSAAMVP